MEKGIDIVLDTVRFGSLIEGADFVFTGEWKIDEQSLHGKVLLGVARRAKLHNVPIVAIVGRYGGKDWRNLPTRNGRCVQHQ